MNRVIVALFALMMIASCGNNTTTKTEDSCCSTASTKSEASCCSSDTTSITKCSNKCDSCSSSKADTNCELVMPGSVQILYMHGKQRCVTCIAIGTEAEALVKELANDKVVMKTIDFSTSEGEVIADKYEIASSSIIIVRDGKVENLTAMAFQYAKSNPEQFKKNLKEAIEKMLE